MSIYDRFVVASVLGGIMLIVVGISDAFIDTSVVRNWIFHSTVFWAVFCLVCWFIAPIVTRYIPVKRAAKDRESDV